METPEQPGIDIDNCVDLVVFEGVRSSAGYEGGSRAESPAGESVFGLRRDVEVQHGSFSLHRFEPGLSDASEEFDVQVGQHCLRTAGPRPTSMDDEIILEVIEER